MKLLKLFSRWLYALIFIAAGILHFAASGIFVRIVPPFLPCPLALVYLSGALEIALGVLLLIPRFARLAAWGLILLLVAVYPANIYMALNPHLFADVDPRLIYLRLPLQFVLIWWGYRLAADERRKYQL